MKYLLTVLAFSSLLFPAIASARPCEPGCAPRLCGACLAETSDFTAPEFLNDSHGVCHPTRFGMECSDGCQWTAPVPGQEDGWDGWSCPNKEDENVGAERL